MSPYLINPNARAERNYRGLFDAEEYHLVDDFFCERPEFEGTPLVHLRALASELGIGDILVKDESSRFGLNSFKILGVSYAVAQLLGEGRLAKDSVVVCASEGNHGRAVAHVAAENNSEPGSTSPRLRIRRESRQSKERAPKS